MFVVTLRFSEGREKASGLMAAHNAWIKQGFDDGVFLLVGSLKPREGGAIVAHATTLAELQQRIGEDPFVAEGVVTAEVLEIAPARADERLHFLMPET
jgi:uncharacterized protein YciI